MMRKTDTLLNSMIMIIIADDDDDDEPKNFVMNQMLSSMLFMVEAII